MLPVHESLQVAELISLNLQDAVVAAVGDVEGAVAVNVDAVGLVEFDFQGRALQAGGALFARAGDADDGAVFGDVFSNGVVLGVGNEDVAVPIEAEMFRAVEGREFRVAAIAGETFGAGAREGTDAALGIDDAQRVPAALEDVDVAFDVGHYGAGIDER